MARISEINEGLYDTFVSPWVRMWTNDVTAEALRMMHPLRFERLAISDMNPMLWPLKVAAETVRQHRRPAAPDNPLRATEKAVAQQIETALDHYRDLRDRGQELAFKAIYNTPLVEALAGLRGAYADARKPRARDEHGERLLAGQDRGDQDPRGAGRLHRGGDQDPAGGRQGRADAGRARACGLPSGSSRSIRC